MYLKMLVNHHEIVFILYSCIIVIQRRVRVTVKFAMNDYCFSVCFQFEENVKRNVPK